MATPLPSVILTLDHEFKLHEWYCIVPEVVMWLSVRNVVAINPATLRGAFFCLKLGLTLLGAIEMGSQSIRNAN